MATRSQTAFEDDDRPANTSFTEAERAAMRAYLQRCEVRLSTQHRIATAFISGAGLMLLIPIFFKDVVDQVLLVLLGQFGNRFDSLGAMGWAPTLLLFGMLAYLLLLSLAIPLYGVYLLLKDIVQFYFTIHAPGFPDSLLNPSLTVNGVGFSPDESARVRQAVMAYQYEQSHIDYMIPFSDLRREEYFEGLIERTYGEIIPPTRNLGQLIQQGLIPPGTDERAVLHFNAALGIARSADRPLIQEVAMTEMALTRNAIFLRRLILRYAKTLLMFIWTIGMLFMMLPVLEDARFPALIVLGLGFLLWSLVVMPVMQTPISWLYRHKGKVERKQVDTQLTVMETRVRPFVIAAIPVSVLVTLLALLVQ